MESFLHFTQTYVYMYIKVYEIHTKENVLEQWQQWVLDLKHLQNTFLVTFLNVIFRNGKHLIARLQGMLTQGPAPDPKC